MSEGLFDGPIYGRVLTGWTGRAVLHDRDGMVHGNGLPRRSFVVPGIKHEPSRAKVLLLNTLKTGVSDGYPLDVVCIVGVLRLVLCPQSIIDRLEFGHVLRPVAFADDGTSRVIPSVLAFWLTIFLPVGVLGPVHFWLLRRFAACFLEIQSTCPPFERMELDGQACD